jgi:hypothetical protein
LLAQISLNNHDVLFTQQAFNMWFSKSSLPDVKLICLYLKEGCLPLDNIELYGCPIQDKLVSTLPECLHTASMRYGKHLQYKPLFSKHSSQSGQRMDTSPPQCHPTPYGMCHSLLLLNAAKGHMA